jgi:type IV pilus assembly protein PilE
MKVAYMRSTQRGVTFVELMTVMVIVAILASIALPSYRQYMRRADRAEAKSALLQNAQFLERNRTVTNRYDLDGVGNEINAAALPVTQSPTNAAARYAITLPTLTQSTYILKAVPAAGGPAEDDVCGTLTLNEQGSKGAEGSASAASCWGK